MYEVYYLGECVGCTSNVVEKGETMKFPGINETFIVSEINEQEKVLFVIPKRLERGRDVRPAASGTPLSPYHNDPDRNPFGR